jgi:hypothetical protein
MRLQIGTQPLPEAGPALRDRGNGSGSVAFGTNSGNQTRPSL